MSGNPFRRQQPDQDSDAPGASTGSKSKGEVPHTIASSRINTDMSCSGKVKKVQFVSPVASPQEAPPSHPRFPSLEELDDGMKSPPPKGVADHPEAIDTRALLRGDLTAGGAIDLKANEREEAVDAAHAANTPLSTDFQLAQPPAGRRGPPANPFSRTLATMESSSPAGAAESASNKQSKSVMDVDSFKRLLLTGKSEAPPGRENGSSTDSSYASKQSTAGSATDARPESPGSVASSLEDASSSDDSSDDEGQSTSKGKGAAIKPSEPSRPTSGPKEVSFDDFDEESLQPAHLEQTQQDNAGTSTGPVRSGSDLHKPLPEPPSSRPTATTTLPAPESQSKKSSTPPPPPTSRRQGQPKPESRSRSSSNVDQTPASTDSVSEQSQQPTRPKPPPPRASATRMVSREAKRPVPTSDAVFSSSEPTNRQSPDSHDAGGSTKVKPPPPPSRNAGKQPQAPLARTTSSSSSITPRHGSPAVSGGPAPPPPPRRRGDSRAVSHDSIAHTGSRRSSIHSAGTDRRDSVSSLQRAIQEEGSETPKTDEVPPVDMLADLDAFQREVDALRAKALGSSR